MNFRQLELELDLILEDAAETPILADLRSLWQQLEPMIQMLSVQDQLRVGSRVIDHLAEVYQAKAHRLLDDWENLYDPQDPQVSADWLQGFVRQTQQVDLSDLTAPVQRRPRSQKSESEPAHKTLVGEVPKANVLNMLDQVELEAQAVDALAVAHEERIQDWVAAIARWFEHHPQPIHLLHLREQLGWPLVQLWLSLLLGGFKLEVTDQHFYSLHIMVSLGGDDGENQSQ